MDNIKLAAQSHVLEHYGLDKIALKYGRGRPPTNAEILKSILYFSAATGALGAATGGLGGGAIGTLRGALSDDPDKSALSEGLRGAVSGAKVGLPGGVLAGLGLGGLSVARSPGNR